MAITGAGTGGATKAVLEAVGNVISSYTYTDISPGFFDKAGTVFEDYNEKMIFKTLDIERSPAEQGFEPHSYDIIIANNVLHATRVLRNTLQNTRHLLKPGGWLVLAEMSDKGPVRFGTIMGGLQGWWLGTDDGRKYTPLICPEEWHAVLREAGFGGIDAVTPKLDSRATWPWSIIAAQAVDDRIRLLRQPLSRIESRDLYHDNIIIMGTGSLETSRLAEELAEHLSRFSHSITILDQLPTEEEARSIKTMSSFINLVDIDQPIFQDITAARMESLKRVYELAANMLWITHGALSADNPYHMASVAFRRVMSDEARHIFLHHLDIANLFSDINVSKKIAEHFLRQTAMNNWDRESPSPAKILNRPYLWSIEPEAFIDKRGRLLIPRLIHNAAQNARLNSSRRVVVSAKSGASLEGLAVLLRHDKRTVLREQSAPSNQIRSGAVHAIFSSLMALSVAGEGFLFLGIGRSVDQADQHVLFLSPTNSKTTTPLISVPVSENHIKYEELLSTVASELVADSIIKTLPSGSKVVLQSSWLEKDELLAYALSREAKKKAIRIAFIVNNTAEIDSNRQQTLDSYWIKLDKRASTTALKSLLPFDATHFVHITDIDDDIDSMLHLLPGLVKRVGIQDLARFDSQPFHFSRF